MGKTVTPEQIIDVATRLFSGLGYDVTSLGLIADAVGAPASVIVELVGDKRELYLKVMERIFEEKRARIQEAVDAPGSGREALHRIADAYLDFYAGQPELLAFWSYRGMSDAADIPDVEDRYMRPLIHLAARRIRDAAPADLDPHALLGVMLWCINGFLGTGVLAPGHGMARASDPAVLRYFRTVLHTVLDRLLADPPPP